MVTEAFPRLTGINRLASAQHIFMFHFAEPIGASFRQSLVDYIHQVLDGIVLYHDSLAVFLKCYEYQIGFVCGYLGRFIHSVEMLEDNFQDRYIERFHQLSLSSDVMPYNDAIGEAFVNTVIRMRNQDCNNWEVSQRETMNVDAREEITNETLEQVLLRLENQYSEENPPRNPIDFAIFNLFLNSRRQQRVLANNALPNQNVPERETISGR